MKRAIATFVMVLALVGFVGLSGAMAATPKTWKAPCCAPGYTSFIGAPGSCPTIGTLGANSPSVMGAVGF
ncbi:MAG: hypothetical protein M0Z81_19075 [Deltaproteobacteria bacterium]|nr:hypothetical protein [Deltaproteobacteria bacterium]